jgi:hypothetical protein
VFGILCFVGQGKTFHGFYRNEISGTDIITPAVKYLQVVIPAEAGIQKNTGCRIKSGMTGLAI